MNINNLKTNKEVVKNDDIYNHWTLKNASEVIKNNKEIVLKAIK